MSTIREGTVETRNLILKSAEEIFLECGYQEASMRKIAARAGITPGAIYKHFLNKEEMFGEIFAGCGSKLMSLTESMMNMDFTAMSDEQLRQVWQSGMSMRTLHMLEGDIRLLHMLLNDDSGGYMERFRKTYIDRCVEFAVNYYNELYKRGLIIRQLRPETIYMLSMAEFTMICEMIADDSCKEGITSEMEQAFQEAMGVLTHGLEAELGFVNKEQWEVRR